MRILTVVGNKNFNAGPKAPRDIINILKKEYNAKSVNLVQSNNAFKKILYRIKIFNNIIISKIKNEILVFQFPIYETSDLLNKIFMFSLKRANKDKTIILIHDLEGLRNDDKRLNKQDVERLNLVKYVIAHNKAMKEYLQKEGVTSNIYTLELFDYLCDGDKIECENEEKDDINSLVYAGNLVKVKSPFVYQVEEANMKFSLNLYGVGLEEQNLSNNKIKYQGKFFPDELPNKLKGKLGLIWDGNFDESDETSGMKQYTKYNNPHKLSCYMAAGLPVVVWEKAACSEFVKKNNIGYVVSSIYEINNIDLKDYEEKKKNVLNIKEKVRSGFYTKRIFENILSDMKG